MMQFLADECIYKSTIDLLKSKGYYVISVKDVGLSGASDREILAKARESKSILLTADLDFSNIVVYPPETHNGIIVLKISKAEEDATHLVLLKVLQEVDPKLLTKALVIVDDNKYRIRHKE